MKKNLFITLTVFLLAACTMANKPGITSESWGTVESKVVNLYTLTNSNGVNVKITNYGCIIVAFNAPDKDGKLENIVLGMGSLKNYLDGHPYFGSIVGRYADIVAGAKFTLDGKEYTLSGDGHGGKKGFDKRVWDATSSCDDRSATLSLKYTSPDGEEGYPGNLTVKLDYILNNDNELLLHYTATTDKPTVLNLTNHSYFNLAGCKEDVRGHHVRIYADSYTPYDHTGNTPTGEIAPLAGTPFDLRQWTVVGDRFKDLPTDGFDHCYYVNGSLENRKLAVELYEPKSGRLLQTYTTEPAVQFYSAIFLDGTLKNAQGVPLTQFMGACFEAQHFANSPNQPNFPTTTLLPSQIYSQSTIYKVGVQ